jgi:hypothetical protein
MAQPKIMLSFSMSHFIYGIQTTATTVCDKGILHFLWLPEKKEIMKKLLWLYIYVTQFSNFFLSSSIRSHFQHLHIYEIHVTS